MNDQGAFVPLCKRISWSVIRGQSVHQLWSVSTILFRRAGAQVVVVDRCGVNFQVVSPLSDQVDDLVGSHICALS
ncbi:hypothetical protein T4B_5026 [Trichinella pseudospiralis]|uniref:Uncharacterized protein n=1 Tax=Trichinella pseudospiralis TaxID=6337 RepID=A0A0V1INN7_TRIPS|nr:hypothetical protein T4B_5026 [Trichinella pseudospiralis]